jgi:protein-S-isoprenylcysteine O-methyltransferase Ste14
MKRLFLALRTLVFATAFIFFWGWLAAQFRRFDAGWGFELPGWSRAAGIAVMALGSVVALACVATFVVRGRGTPVPFDPPREFVAVGLYRYVRNPMYLGGAAMLVGWGLYLRSLSVLLFALPWFLLAHLFVVRYEEPALKRKFGAAYSEYLRTVPRWIPRRSRPSARG